MTRIVSILVRFLLMAVLPHAGILTTTTTAFSPLNDGGVAATRIMGKNYGTTTTTSQLFSTTPPPRQPRRNLKKRQRRGERKGAGGLRQQLLNKKRNSEVDNFPWDTAESRPLVKSISKEFGEDYWIDEKDLQAEQQRQQAIKNRKAMEGEVSKEKLWSEVKAPYKQNWIGYFSVIIAILSVVIIKFPELLDQPLISYPDL